MQNTGSQMNSVAKDAGASHCASQSPRSSEGPDFGESPRSFALRKAPAPKRVPILGTEGPDFRDPEEGEMVAGQDATFQVATERSRSLPAWVIIAAFAILIGFLALIAWGLNRAQQPPIQVGDMVPPFTLSTFDGKEVKLGSLSGKVVLVNFWASWCKPCEQEAAELQEAWQIYEPGGKVVFLGVDWVDTEPEAKVYLSKFNITYANGPDLRTSISQLFRIKGVPETYIIGKDGRLTNFKIGPYGSVAEIQGMIDKQLK
jgi:cytochrome c biogenesis protein CcmG/thiol:disulfide interchange protein DsbE